MPVGLLDHIQTICARQDQQFITDVAQILGLPVADMRRKILGVLGTPTLVCTESNPWWVETQCPVMVLSRHTSMWSRCGNMCEAHGTCNRHRVKKTPVYTDPRFAEMETRTPFRLDGELYWVAEDGSVLDATGVRQMDFYVNLKSRTVSYIKKQTHAASSTKSSSPSSTDESDTGTEHVASAMESAL
jgi:tellurite resistance-related uncharacterized protein